MNKKSQKKKSTPAKLLKFEEMTWKQIDALDRKKTIFFLPISPLEEHGPHLPIGTDILTAQVAANEAIKWLQYKRPELTYVLLPPVPVGFCKFNTDFPGSVSVSGRVVKDIVYSYCSSLGNHGFKFVVICTYHMAIGHLKGIYAGMKKAMKAYDMQICEPWGPYFYHNEVEKREPKLGFDTSKEVHAGFRETSLMKYQYPYLVDESYKTLQSIYRDLTSPKVLGKSFKQLGLKDGYVGSPARADADYGRWFFSETVNVYAKAALALYDGKPLPTLPKKTQALMHSLFWQ
ncbi:MAG: creatininase family protein [Candidatus Thermoplasmatota archaeon]|nr:creatininase family protein [Candidatus Thermoplasmatota archaeon]